MKVLEIVIIIVIIILIVYFLGIYLYNNIEFYKYKKDVSKHKYVAHALGGINNNTYTNSKEALENSYNCGIRFFEVDVRLTSDEKLICTHGWSKKDYKERLGLTYNEKNPTMSYDDFINSKIQGQYTSIDFKEFIDFMKIHKDMYAMIDIGNKDFEYTKKVYKKIVEICNKKNILNRFIVGGQTTDMIEAIKEVYYFKLINLYWADKDSRKDTKINTKEKFLQYCKKTGISSLSTSTDTFNNEKSTIKYFKDNGLIVYVFTENDEEKAKEYLEEIDLVGTDFIKIKQ